jgi:hypothetical protein
MQWQFANMVKTAARQHMDKRLPPGHTNGRFA